MNRIVSNTEREREGEKSNAQKKKLDKFCQLANASKETFKSTRLQGPRVGMQISIVRFLLGEGGREGGR